MNKYIIFTDSGCDILPSTLNEWGVKYASLTFKFDGEDKEYSNNELSTKEFYENMRAGKSAKTSAVNIEAFKDAFEPELQKGNDVLYIAFSSGLSTTYNSGRMAALELQEKYPDRKVIAVDTLCASAGLGLVVYLAVKMKNEGASIEEVEKYITDNKLSICHWVTVDDLVYLKRGGRISSAVALAGTVLGIKPIIHVDNEGKLQSVGKARGRKAAIKHLADKVAELILDKENGTIFISHADCADDISELEKILKTEHNSSVDLITDIGPVVGSHAGPGTIAIFFIGKER